MTAGRLIALRPSPLQLLNRWVRCAYISWRIREAEKDERALQRQIAHDKKQADVYRGAIEAMRCELAAVEAGL
ncbi:hypothetical protein [Methylibium sp. Pch-M]|uniref:hypothetical protein n=1 Tax=Methylibium sp. Pch-M TaxID=2082386 RepID=UPI0013EA4C94|nr:hypothetical protein [Methylibium sp. Pch-M]